MSVSALPSYLVMVQMLFFAVEAITEKHREATPHCMVLVALLAAANASEGCYHWNQLPHRYKTLPDWDHLLRCNRGSRRFFASDRQYRFGLCGFNGNCSACGFWFSAAFQNPCSDDPVHHPRLWRFHVSGCACPHQRFVWRFAGSHRRCGNCDLRRALHFGGCLGFVCESASDCHCIFLLACAIFYGLLPCSKFTWNVLLFLGHLQH